MKIRKRSFAAHDDRNTKAATALGAGVGLYGAGQRHKFGAPLKMVGREIKEHRQIQKGFKSGRIQPNAMLNELSRMSRNNTIKGTAKLIAKKGGKHALIGAGIGAAAGLAIGYKNHKQREKWGAMSGQKQRSFALDVVKRISENKKQKKRKLPMGVLVSEGLDIAMDTSKAISRAKKSRITQL